MEKSQKYKIYLAGGVIGAVVGFIISYAIVQNAEHENQTLSISSKQGLQIGLNTMNLIRNISHILQKR